MKEEKRKVKVRMKNEKAKKEGRKKKGWRRKEGRMYLLPNIPGMCQTSSYNFSEGNVGLLYLEQYFVVHV